MPLRPAMERISRHGLRQPRHHRRQAPASACPARDRSRSVTVRLPFAISSAAAVMSFIAAISVFRLFLISVEVAVVVVGDRRRDVSLADLVHVAGRNVQRPDHCVQHGIHAAHDLRIGALELICFAALGELAVLRSFGQPRQFLVQALQHQADIVDRLTFIFSWSPL